jgi:pimeloyl-ACP methyl ester carboxylesterase
MKGVLALALGLVMATAVSTVTRAATPDGPENADLHMRSGERRALVIPRVADNMQPGTYAQAIDHSGALPNQTFNQRYWYDSEFAAGPNAPVLYHMCGETDVDGSYFLSDYALEWARQLGARVVFLEHRYYGQSQPFGDISSDHLKYLTLDNVMEDLASFQKWIAASQGWTGKWIALGGSYSATMAALYRQKHPELVVGALASSAPMISGVGQDTDGSSNEEGDDRAWTYQACTEVGYWQAEGADRGAQLDLPSSSFCQQAFGSVSHYDASAYNAAYDAPFISKSPGSPSNILFTEGSADVWTDIGLATQQNANPNITVLTIDGAGHHFDLNASDGTDGAAVTGARQQFLTLAKQWLGQP